MAFTPHLPYSEAFSHNTPARAVRSTQRSRSTCHSCLTTPLLSAPGSMERSLPSSRNQGVSPSGSFHASMLMSMWTQRALGPHVQVDDCRSGPRACRRPPLLPAQRFLRHAGLAAGASTDKPLVRATSVPSCFLFRAIPQLRSIF